MSPEDETDDGRAQPQPPLPDLQDDAAAATAEDTEVRTAEEAQAPAAGSTAAPVAEDASGDTVPIAAPTQEELPRKPLSAKDIFLSRVAGDLPSAALSAQIEAPAGSQTASLVLENAVGLVASEQLEAELSRYCSTVPLGAPDESVAVSWGQLDALVIEGRIHGHAHPWRRALLNIGDAPRALYDLIDTAQSQTVPVVLWITEEAAALDHFRHLFDRVDLVVLPIGAEDIGPRGLALDPCVDVKTFNPFKDNPYRAQKMTALFPFLVDGAHEIGMEYGADGARALFDPLFDYNWWLTDSSFDIRNNNFKIPAVMRRRFVGPKRHDSIASLLSYALAYVLPRAMTATRPHHGRRRAWQASAAKACVFTDDPEFGFAHAGLAETPEALQALCRWATEDPVGTAAVQHLAWRDAVANHSYFEGLAAIFDRIGVTPRANAPLDPHVNIVVPTIRPDLIPFVMRTVAGQTHKNCSVTIVANGVSVPDDIARMVDAAPNVRLVSMPRDKSIGYCLNFGIDQVEADYWAKIDDDDIYGAHYLSDLLLQRKYLDFDVTGKAAVFTYFEAEESLHIRTLVARDAPETFLAGGTLLSRAGVPAFPEDVRGYADVLFLVNAAEEGCRLTAADPFNFIQVRRADRSSHTWTAGAHQLNLKGPQRGGMTFEGVLV